MTVLPMLILDIAVTAFAVWPLCRFIGFTGGARYYPAKIVL